MEKTIERLDESAIRALLTSQTRSALPRIDIVDLIPSTSDYLFQKIAEPLPSGTVCIAEGQTAGRGRQGQKWVSPLHANIYLSLYWRFPNKLQDLSGLSLVIGLVVLEALKNITPLPAELGIKWPNDIWYRNAKLGGILIENVNAQLTRPPFVTDTIIGVGLNVAFPPGEAIQNDWTDLQQALGFILSKNKVIAFFLNTLIPTLEQFQQKGFSHFRSLWDQYDLLKNKKVQILMNNSKETGVAQGVNEQGGLCIRTGNQWKVIHYGEVSIRPDR